MVVGSPPPHRTGTRTGIEQKKRRKIEGNFNDRVLTGTCLRVCVFFGLKRKKGVPQLVDGFFLRRHPPISFCIERTALPA